MNILYIHGFRSFFDREAPKVKTLEQIGTVFGIDLDYGMPHETTKRILIDCVNDNNIDLVIGTSLGGYWSGVIGSATGLPFVACNPSINPAESLKRAIGSHKTFNHKNLVITAESLATYGKFDLNGCGLILLDKDDELFNYQTTVDALSDAYNVIAFDGGNHGFLHMQDSLMHINELYQTSNCNYGLEL